MCVPIREASVPSGEDGLGLQGGPADGTVHSEITGQFPSRAGCRSCFLVSSSLYFVSYLSSLLCSYGSWSSYAL